jgi:maleylacetoacetate isomerase
MPVVLMAEIALYNYWRSSSSHRVRIALGLKGLAYRYVAVDLLAGEHTSSAYAARSPTGFVPCLVLDGTAYVESVAIVELLEERFPAPPLYPSDARGRARVRALVEIVNSGTQPLQNVSVLRFRSPDADTQRSWAQHFVRRGLASFEAAVAAHEQEGTRGPYAYGDTPTAADVFLVPQVVSAKRFGVDLAPFPRIVRAFDQAMKLDAVRAAAPEAQHDAPPRGA